MTEQDVAEAALLDAETRIDSAVKSLKLLTLTRDRALLGAARAFEDRLRFRFHQRAGREVFQAEVIHYKDALKVLVRWIYKYCSNSDRSAFIDFDEEAYSNAFEALEFAGRYSVAELGYIQWKQGRYSVVLDGRRIVFQGPSNEGADRDAVGLLLTRWKEQVQIGESFASNTFRTTPQELMLSVRQSFKKLNEHAISYNPTNLVSDYAGFAAELGIHPPQIFRDASNGVYTVSEAMLMWRYLLKRTIINSTYCFYSGYSGMIGGALGSIVEVVSKDALSNEVANDTELPNKITSQFINDLIFPVQRKADCRVYPLLPIDLDRILLVPQLFFTANWETLLLRMWARDYSGPYSVNIAVRKKELSERWAAWFRKNGWLVAVDREYSHKGGGVLGDVDVGVYSPKNNVLLLFELKWLIPGDDVEEVIHNDSEIEFGIAQVRRSTDFAREHLSRFFELVFRTKAPTTPPEVFSAVLNHGQVPSSAVDAAGVSLLDLELCEGFLGSGPSLDDPRDLFIALSQLLEMPKEGKDYSLVRQKFSLTGSQFSLPGIAYPGHAAEHDMDSKRTRNESCHCGSGRKFKRCCGFWVA